MLSIGYCCVFCIKDSALKKIQPINHHPSATQGELNAFQSMVIQIVDVITVLVVIGSTWAGWEAKELGGAIVGFLISVVACGVWSVLSGIYKNTRYTAQVQERVLRRMDTLIQNQERDVTSHDN